MQYSFSIVTIAIDTGKREVGGDPNFLLLANLLLGQQVSSKLHVSSTKSALSCREKKCMHLLVLAAEM